MSRISICTFLSKAKRSLSQSLTSKGELPASFVIGNESADLDSITCALVYGYIHANKAEARKANRCIIPITNIPSSELALRPELTALLKHADLKPSDLVTLDDIGEIDKTLPPERTDWTLVDHNVLQGSLGKHYLERVSEVIDHHEDEDKVPKDANPRIIEKTGSCNSHIINCCREMWDAVSSSISTDAALDEAAHTPIWDAQVAKLAIGAILIDTINLTAEEKVTDHDRKAVKYLEAKIRASSIVGPSYDRDSFFKEINDAKSNLDDLDLVEILRKDYKQWTEGDLTLGISSVVQPIKYLKTKDEDLAPALLSFAKGRDLDVFAVMTAHNDSGAFGRELLLLAVKDGKAGEVVRKFVDANAEDLKLEGSGADVAGSSATWMRLWEQKNLAASRKKVAPLLREAMG